MEKVKKEKNAFDSMLNVFAWLSFIVAVILAVAVFLSSFSGTDNGRSLFGYKMLIVRSDSMSKANENQKEEIYFSAGDLIIIKEVKDISTIAVDDVISFISYNPDSIGKTLTHKVRSIVTDGAGRVLGFETYGINTGQSDLAIVDPSTVIGKYVGKSEALGDLFTYFKTPAGYFTAILIPCVLLIIFFSIKVGQLLTKREMHRTYYQQFETLNDRIQELEQKKGEVIMQTDACLVEQHSEASGEINQTPVKEQTPSIGQVMGANGQPVIQIPYGNDKALEIMAKALSDTIESLTKTIDTLASAVGKPVDTLARSVETLASANSKNTVVEKVIEKPVVKTVIKEVAVAPVKEEKAVAPIQVQVVDEKPVKEQPSIAFESVTGGAFSDFNQVEKLPFSKKLLSLNSEVKEYFSEVHNELISFKKVNYRISFKGVSYRVGRETIAKIVVRGKTLKLHLALNVNDYSKTIFFQEDASGVKAYEEVPFAVKIKSERAKNNALKLVNSLAENKSLVKDEQFKKENVLKQLKKN